MHIMIFNSKYCCRSAVGIYQFEIYKAKLSFVCTIVFFSTITKQLTKHHDIDTDYSGTWFSIVTARFSLGKTLELACSMWIVFYKFKVFYSINIWRSLMKKRTSQPVNIVCCKAIYWTILILTKLSTLYIDLQPFYISAFYFLILSIFSLSAYIW